MVSDVAGKLEVRPAVLGEWGKEGVKLGLSKMDDMGSGFFSKLFKVELGSSMKGFDSGCRSEQGWGADDVGIGIDGGGLKGVRVNKGNAGVGKRGGVLGGLGNVDIVGHRASGFKEGEARDDELEAEFGTGSNGGRPGDNGGQRRAGGVLEIGASRTWVIPSVVRTVEDVVDDLKGGGGVLLVDSIQVRPRGNGEGR